MSFAALVGLLSITGFAGADQLVEPTEPMQVAGGVEVGTCGWPTAVALRGGGQPFCTGTVVHPRVVMLAAHCIDPQFGWGAPDTIGFGEDGFNPIADIPTSFCEWHPGWDQGNTEGFDIAYCVMAQAVDVDIVPPLMGCEWDAMVPGVETHIVGYGADIGIIDVNAGGWVFTDGNGPKRTAPQTLEGVFDNAAYLLGNNAGGCPGDSGGPAMVQMADGTWRVIGAASRIHPDAGPGANDNWCLHGTVYSTFSHVMPWIEQNSGFDITPCHDANGNWDPDERCGFIPLDPANPATTSGTWQDGCASNQLSGLGELCGPPFDGVPPEPPPPEPPEPPPPEPPPPEPPEPPPPPPEPPPPTPPSTTGTPPPPGDGSDGTFPGGTASDGSSGGDAGLEGDGFADRGCTCHSQRRTSGAWWLLLVPLWWRRRRA
ncbi:MAG: trypsin-like serine protease [Deltaproteobacteria bacterium]|nr:trypsin-like serine protease [Deltaproteobacteria bacterium]